MHQHVLDSVSGQSHQQTESRAFRVGLVEAVPLLDLWIPYDDGVSFDVLRHDRPGSDNQLPSPDSSPDNARPRQPIHTSLPMITGPRVAGMPGGNASIPSS